MRAGRNQRRRLNDRGAHAGSGVRVTRWRSGSEQRAEAAEQRGLMRRGRLALRLRSRGGTAAIGFTDRGWQHVAILQILVSDNLGVAADHDRRPTIALRKPAAEIVDG